MSELLERVKAALASRCTIQRELGRGGMATVFLAEERHPRRQVAVKVLDPAIAASLGPDRFLREVDLASNLTHPHILPIYTAGESDGLLYYVMPYVQGETLRERIAREKQLAIDDALQIANEVADALTYAHGRGVIHRDIKPDNILLSAGHAQVADFGIARAITAAGGESLTATGIAVGTPVYMSPEQAAGDREVDGRSDLYSLGCVVYEMLAGEPPFTGPTVESVLHQHLTIPPPAVTNLRPTVPGEISSVLTRALAKAPADRFPTIEHFARALSGRARTDASTSATGTRGGTRTIGREFSKKPGVRALTLGAVGVALVLTLWFTVGDFIRGDGVGELARDESARMGTSIAVLPFSVQASTELGYLRDGMVNLLSTKLDGAGDLRSVDPRTLLRFTERENLMPGDPTVGGRVADAFDADLYVVGDLVEASGRIQLTASLYEPRRGSEPIGQAAVQGGVSQLFDLVDELASQLLSGLSGGPASRVRRIAAVTTPSLAALKAFLEGEELFRRAQFGAAVEAFQRAVAEDSLFALAYYRLSLTAEWNLQDDLARAAAEQAVRYDERLSERDRRLLEAFLVRRRGANADAERFYRSILGTNPDEMEAWLDLGEVLFHANPLRGRSFTESREALERVLEFDPRHSTALIHLSRLVAYERKLPELDSLVALFLALNPEPGRRLELDALRAFGRGDPGEIEATMVRLQPAGDLGVALAVWAAGVYSADIVGAGRVAELLTAPHRAPEARRLGFAWLAHLDLASGRWRSANERFAALARLSEGAALEYRALLVRAPWVPVNDDELRRLATGLENLDPQSIPVSDNPSVVFTAHDRLHPLIRLYNLALLRVRLGDLAAARRHAQQLVRIQLPATAGSLAEDLARSVRAEILMREERLDDALAEREGARMETWYGQTMASPLYSQVFERFRRAELLRAVGRLEEASQWFAHLVQTSPFELPYLALAHLRRAEIADQLGQIELALDQYARFVELWRDADPELQPLVESARRRMGELGASHTT